MLWVRDFSWSPNCISQGCVTHNLHSVTLSRVRWLCRTNPAQFISALLYQRERGPGGAGQGTEEDSWSEGDGASASEGKAEKAETPLQFGEKAAEQGYDWDLPVHKGGGSKDKVIHASLNTVTSTATRELLLGGIHELKHCCQGCFAWGHDSTREATRPPRLFCESMVLWFYSMTLL